MDQSARISRAVVVTPLGPMLLHAEEAGLTGAWFLLSKTLPALPLLLKQQIQAASQTPGTFFFAPADSQDAIRWLKQSCQELTSYFEGSLRCFETPLSISGTPFQKRIWTSLQSIAYGECRTYSELSQLAGCPGKYRATGSAVGKNPLSIFIPCHRIIGKNNDLTGYAAGLDIKKRLLTLEKAL